MLNLIFLYFLQFLLVLLLDNLILIFIYGGVIVNYNIFRMMLLIIVWVSVFFIGSTIFMKFYKWNKRIATIMAIFATIFAIFVISLPIGEKKRFKTLEEAFRYYFPNATIEKKYEENSYAFIFLKTQKNSDSSVLDFVYFIHDRDGWNMGRTDAIHYGHDKESIQSDHSIIITNKIERENVTGVFIFSTVFSNFDEPTITDSFSTNFELVDSYPTYVYVGIVDSVIDDNYTITFNDKIYHPLK